MKNLLLCVLTGCLFLTTSLFSFGQCPNDNSTNGFPNPFNPSGPGIGGSITSTNSWGGDYLETTNVVAGNTYTWEVTGTSSFDAAFTLRQQPGGAVLAFDDNTVGQDPRIVWTAGFTGTVRLNIDQMPGCVNNSVHLPVRLSFTSACTPPTVSSNPSPASVCPGASASFTASASGQDSLRWQVSTNGGATWVAISNVSPYSGATTGTLNINPATAGMNGFLYRLMAFACSPAVADSSNAALLTTSDVTNPVITCPGAQTIFVGASCQASLPDYTGLATTSDNCDPSPVVTQSPAAGTTVSGHNTNVTVSLFSTDASLNSATCTFTTTAQDTTSPNAICQNITVFLDGAGNSTITAGDVDGGSSDNCGVGGLSASPSSFTCANTGANSVTLTVSDAAGNNSNCTATVSVQDSTSPIAICQNITVFLDGAGNASITGGDVNNGSTDNCGLGSLSASPAAFTCANVGANSVTLTVTDVSGNSNTCTATVTVADTLPPTAVCQNDTAYLDASGNAFILATQLDGGSFNTCNDPMEVVVQDSGNASVNLVSAQGSIAPGPYTATLPASQPSNGNVTLTVYGSGDLNSSSEYLQVYVNGQFIGNAFAYTGTTSWMNQAFTLPASMVNDSLPGVDVRFDRSPSVGSGLGYARLSYNALTPTTDTLYLGCGDVGTQTFTVQVTDLGNGMMDTCSASVTVFDTISPVAACQNITVNLDSAGSASIVGNDVDNGSSDACGISSVSVLPASFSCSDLGANAVVLTVDDPSGNIDTCHAIVTITDTAGNCLQATATVDSNVTCNGGSDGGASAVPVGGSGPYSYLWSTGDTTASVTGLSAGFYSVTVSDNGLGLTATASVTITEPPILAVSAVVSSDYNGEDISCNGFGDGEATATASGGTGPYSYLWSNGDTSQVAFPLSAGTYMVTVTDANGCFVDDTITLTEPTALVANAVVDSNVSCNGLSDGGMSANPSGGTLGYSYLWDTGAPTQSVTGVSFGLYGVTVSDGNGCASAETVLITQPPVLVVGAVLDSIPFCPGSPDGGASATVSGGSPGYSYLWNNGDTTGSITGLSSGTYSVMVMDVNGCSDSASVTINASDSIPPTITCPAPIFANNDVGQCGAVINYSASASDNCSTPIVNVISGPTSGSLFPVGLTTVELQAVDSAGNADTCFFNVQVFDVSSPTISCQSSIVVNTDSGQCDAVVTFPTPTAADNCPGVTVTQTLGQASGSTFALGTSTVRFRATDSAGNSTNCQFNITVVDNEAPMAVCMNDTVYLNASGQASIVAADVNGGSSDACGIANISANPVAFNCGDQGMNNVTLTVTDNNGNVSNCAATVWVMDTISPAALCVDTLIVSLDTAGNGMTSVASANFGSNDNCGLDSLWLSQTAFTCADLGWSVVSLIARDDAGNTASCSIDLLVSDPIAPELTCPADTVIFASDTACGTVFSYAMPSFQDNCSLDTMIRTQGLPSGALFPNGTTHVVWQAWDVGGNQDSCGFNVTVLDTVAPAISCPSDTTLFVDSASCTATLTYPMPTADDNCGATVAQIAGLGSGLAFPVGMTTEGFVASDTSGNVDSCSFMVTVLDTISPVIDSCPSSITVFADSSFCGWVNNLAVPSITDNCMLDTMITNVVAGDTLPIGTDTLFYYAEDIYGNSSLCSFVVQVDPSPVSLQTFFHVYSCGFGVTCNGDSNGWGGVMVSGGCEPYAYAWSNGATTDSISGLAAGTYTVTVTDGNGASDTASITLMEPAVLMADSFIVAEYPGGVNVSCYMAADGSAEVFPAGGCGPYEYLWSTGDTTAMINGLMAGTYGVSVTDQNGCMTTDSVALIGPDSLAGMYAVSTDTCLTNTGAIQLTIMGGTSGYDVFWSTGSTAMMIDSLPTGWYSVNVTDTNGCMFMDSIWVPVFEESANLIADDSTRNICQGQTTTLVAMTGFNGYSWNTGDTTSSITVGSTGTYVVVAEDSNGCRYTDSIEVVFNNANAPNPVIVPGPVTGFCSGDSVTLDAGPGYFDHLWSTGDTGRYFTTNHPGNYAVTVWNGYGCQATSDSVEVDSFPSPTKPMLFQSGNQLTSTPAVSYAWWLDGSLLPGITTRTIIVNQGGYYQVMITDSNGCTAVSDSFKLVITGVGAEAYESLEVFPNPFEGKVNIDLEMGQAAMIRLEVVDVLGQVVWKYQGIREEAHFRKEIDLQHTANGIYYIRIQAGDRNWIRKVVKQ